MGCPVDHNYGEIKLIVSPASIIITSTICSFSTILLIGESFTNTAGLQEIAIG
jgi:hypothetical protein